MNFRTDFFQRLTGYMSPTTKRFDGLRCPFFNIIKHSIKLLRLIFFRSRLPIFGLKFKFTSKNLPLEYANICVILVSYNLCLELINLSNRNKFLGNSFRRICLILSLWKFLIYITLPATNMFSFLLTYPGLSTYKLTILNWNVN